MERRAKIMMGQFRKATQEPNEYIKFAIDPNDINTWYILLTNFEGDESEYTWADENNQRRYAEILCRMVAPKDFPFKPPEFYLLTPNGVYDIKTTVCISIGKFHSEQYRSTLGMSGFANQLVSGLIGWKSLGSGISLLNTSIEQKKIYAISSHEYNLEHNGEILEMINKSYEIYSAKWKK